METGRISFSYTTQEIFTLSVMAKATAFTYHPGVCNIDSKGVSARRKLGYIVAVVGIVVVVAMFVMHIEPVFRAIAAAGFAFGAVLNFLQVKEQFCVVNATTRTTEIDLKKTKIVDDLYKGLDLKKRNAMIVRASLIAIICGLIGLLPL